MMRTKVARPLAVATLAALACAATTAQARSASADGAPLKVVSVLDCPANEGQLTRTARATDGQSCDYQSARGEFVRLRVAPLNGRSPADALAPARAQLHVLLPVYSQPVSAVDDDTPGDRADVDLPFIHVHSAGGRADVNFFGFKIHSEGENADVDLGRRRKRAVVHASAKGAEVRAEDVGQTNASLVYVLSANSRLQSGYRAAGYVARGPVTGPLVVGEFRTAQRHTYVGDGGRDLERLIDRNVRP